MRSKIYSYKNDNESLILQIAHLTIKFVTHLKKYRMCIKINKYMHTEKSIHSIKR